MEYILVKFPEIQGYMHFDWFRAECYLCQAHNDQKHHDQSYFIPKKRYMEIEEELIAEMYSSENINSSV